MRPQVTGFTYLHFFLYWLYTVIAALLGTLVSMQVSRLVSQGQLRQWGFSSTLIGDLLMWQINGVSGVAILSAAAVGATSWYAFYFVGHWCLMRLRGPNH